MRNEARSVFELETSSWIVRSAVRYAPPITLVLQITQRQVLWERTTTPTLIDFTVVGRTHVPQHANVYFFIPTTALIVSS